MPDTHSAAPAPKPVAPAEAPDASKVVTLFVMIVAILYFGKEVLVPVTLALLLAFVLAPLVNLLRRIHVGRVPSVLLGVVLALGVILAIGAVIGTQVADLATDLPRYAARVETKVASVRRYSVDRITDLVDKIGAHTARPAAGAGTAPPSAAPAGTAQATMPAQPIGSSPIDMAEHYLSPVLSPLATFGIVFVVAVFALLQKEDLRDRLIRLVGSGDLHRTTVAIDDGAGRLSRYFLTQLCINTIFGAVIGLGLLVIGVPNPVLWGILSALLRFVPYVGSFISAVLPLTLAAAVEPGWSMVLWTLGLYVVVETVTGQVIEPLVYGHSTGLSPFSVVVAAIFWSWVWGPIGLILSTPLTLCLVVMGRHVRHLEFLDVMLGDRPALTPVESFYQRILAGDADEARDHAETLLKERSLSSYYDEVALKGLQLAAVDAQRGTLHQEQLDRIKETIKDVIHDLDAYEDREPTAKEGDERAVVPPRDEKAIPHDPVPDTADTEAEKLPAQWQSESAVLCLAGRGPLDEAAAAMLAQLLGKHGIGARLVPYKAVSRNEIGSLDVRGVAMACISYLEISGHPSHLRYLLERLRQRLPGAPLLVGLWPQEDAILKDATLRRRMGADYYTSSLHDAVDACMEEARTGVSREAGLSIASTGSKKAAPLTNAGGERTPAPLVVLRRPHDGA